VRDHLDAVRRVRERQSGQHRSHPAQQAGAPALRMHLLGISLALTAALRSPRAAVASAGDLVRARGRGRRECPYSYDVAGRALAIGALTYKSVASILKNNLDRAPPAAESSTVIEHQNLRGPGYFH
jgi:hypothetical protein